MRKNNQRISQNLANSVERPEINSDTSAELKNGAVCSVEDVIEATGIGWFQVKLVILSGLVWMARGFEMIVMRSLSSLLSCKFEVKRWQGALLTTITTFSTILGCLLYGIWSDKYGRRTALSSCLIFLFVFSAVSAGLPSYTWIVIFRVVSGFAIGGLPQALVLCVEYMPRKQRGRAVYFLACFWALGIVLMMTLLFVTHESKGSWRIFIAIGSLPAFLSMIMMRFFPESFRFLLVSNRYVGASEIVLEMAETNKISLSGHINLVTAKKYRGRLIDFLNSRNAVHTLIFWFLGMSNSICFNGLCVVTPILFEKGTKELFAPSETTEINFMNNLFAYVPCLDSMPTEQFIYELWTSALDFPGFVIYMILVGVIDRKRLLSGSYFLISLFIFLLFIPEYEPVMYVVFAYCARTLLVSQFDLLLLMAAEVFPTTHRGTAVGLEAASFYLGQFLSSYILQCLLMQGIILPIIVYGTLMLVSCALGFFLQPETKGVALRDILIKEEPLQKD